MGTGYTRADVSNNIADGNVINASDLDLEFDAVQSAFDAATGHTHDGTTGEGAPIEVTGPAQEYVSTATELRPKTNNTYDLGSASLQWKDLYVDGTANLDTVDIDAGNIDGTTIGGTTPAAGTFTTLTATGNVTLGDAATDTVTITADVASNIIPSADNTYDLGASGSEWKDLYIDGTANIDSLVADTADINGGTIDGTTIGGASAAAGTFTNVTATGTVNLSGATVSNGGSVTTVDINGGTIDGTVIGGSTPAAISGTDLTIEDTQASGGVGIDIINVGDGGVSTTPYTYISSKLNPTRNGGEIRFTRADVYGSAATADSNIELYTALDDVNTLVFKASSGGDISFYEDTGTTPKFFWDASAEALGIGTSSPAGKLDVAGNISASGVSGGTRYIALLNETNTYTGALTLQAGGGSTGFGGGMVMYGHSHATYPGSVWIGRSAGSTGPIMFGSGGTGPGTEQMRIDSSGNVGIGTSSPAFSLDVVRSSDNAIVSIDGQSAASKGALLRLRKGGTDTAYIGQASAILGGGSTDNDLLFWAEGAIPQRFYTNGSERMRIDGSGNMGIGTSSPSAKLHVLGASAESVRIAYDATKTARLGVTSSGDLQVYAFDGSNYKNILLAVDATTSAGNVGIGVTAPAYKLDVSLANDQFILAREASGNINNGFRIAGPNNEPKAIFSSNSATGECRIGGINTNYFQTIYTNNTERMRIDSSGNVGIGTSSPGAKLVIDGGTSADQLRIGTDPNYYKIGRNSVSGPFEFYGTQSGVTGYVFGGVDGERMRIDSSGNVGIGTSSPSNFGGANLQVQNSTIASVLWTDGTRTGQLLASASAEVSIGSRSNHPLRFGTNDTERARIDTSGNLLVGVTGTLAGGAHVIQAGNNVNALQLQNNGATPYGPYINFSAATPNNAVSYFMLCQDATASRFTLRSNGGLANYQSNDVDLSDERTKTEIVAAPSYWDKIAALEIVTYKYKDQTHDDVNVGVIAQQVETVEPVWVDSDGFGKTPEGEEPLKTVYTKDITFAAIKALQEAMARIEALEARLAALEA